MCIWLLCVGVRDDLDDATALAVGVLLGECLVTLVGGVGEFNAHWVILCWPEITIRCFVQRRFAVVGLVGLVCRDGIACGWRGSV